MHVAHRRPLLREVAVRRAELLAQDLCLFLFGLVVVFLVVFIVLYVYCCSYALFLCGVHDAAFICVMLFCLASGAGPACRRAPPPRTRARRGANRGRCRRHGRPFVWGLGYKFADYTLRRTLELLYKKYSQRGLMSFGSRMFCLKI